MQLLVNGVVRALVGTSVTDAVDELGYRDACVATAVNGCFVSISERHAHALVEGDVLEVVAPMQGG